MGASAEMGDRGAKRRNEPLLHAKTCWCESCERTWRWRVLEPSFSEPFMGWVGAIVCLLIGGGGLIWLALR